MKGRKYLAFSHNQPFEPTRTWRKPLSLALRLLAARRGKIGSIGVYVLARTIPLARGTAVDESRLHKRRPVLIASVGAGFTAGTALLRWEI